MSKLKLAANWFAKTSLDGWNGTTWVSGVAHCTLLPYDRFISARPFGSTQRQLLVDPDAPIPSQYTVVRLTGTSQVYLVGFVSQDIKESPYSLIYLVHQGTSQCNVARYTQTTAASGVKGAATKSTVATLYCDVEVVTQSAVEHLDGIKVGDALVFLPSDANVTNEDILEVGTTAYEVNLVYDYLGFKYARCTVRKT